MPDTELTPSQGQGIAELIAAGIAKGMADVLQRLAPQKETVGQYLKKRRRKVRLTSQLFQNGFWVQETNLSDKEIELANKIHRPGRYISRRVEVLVAKNSDDDPMTVDLRYNEATIDQRMTNATLWRNFEDLLRQVVAEQEVAEENALDAATRPRR